MNKCLFTYQEIQDGENYSLEGLKKLHPKLTRLKIFPYDRKEQMREVQALAGKISIQGVQSKLSGKLSLKDEAFLLTEIGGTFILKPQVEMFEQLPENEDLTMHLAELAKISVPWHGLLRAKDGSLLYVIKRFDRLSRNKKLLQEDFAQLMDATRTTKYQASMERVAKVVEQYCSFPMLELPKLFRLTIFSFLIGNEDLHLKNFSLQTALDGSVRLTPAYDLVNTTIITVYPQEELALELNKKKCGFSREDFLDYYAVQHLLMNKKLAEKIVSELLALVPIFDLWIDRSFLTDGMKKKYKEVVAQRAKRLI